MKLLHILFSVILLFTTAITAADSPTVVDILEDWSDENQYEDRLEQIISDFVAKNSNIFVKRADESTVDSITNILQIVNNSGIVLDILNEVASNPNSSLVISNFIIQLLKSSRGVIEGFNVTVNFSAILSAVKASGIIESVAGGLLVNDKNRETLGNVLGPGLSNSPWLGFLLLGLGNGHDLTVDYIADLIKTTPNKRLNASATTDSKSVAYGFHKRDDSNSTDEYSGSLQDFLNNVASQVLNSELLGSSLEDILIAVNQSGIVVPLVLEILQSPSISKMSLGLVKNLYSSGVLENVNINYYYRLAQKSNMLSEGLEYIVSDPTWSPPIGKLLLQLELSGVYQNLQDAMYGPHH
ncbi:uncharacterized protein RJT21DRAFT_122343 [Scheffersomyces amazonensis]|uniref:uncharacterized protein n=1 Tax=Scheffersomyces amazonensis TaxID=1078765 RepID=UPI00315DEC9D